MIESALSPPYDGSEFEELFPELTGVEPEEMVDIESLADRALESLDQSSDAVENPSVRMSDKISVNSVESNSEGSVSAVSDEEEEEEDADQLLRYLIGQTSRKSKRIETRRQSSKSSNDSGQFSDGSHDQTSSIGHVQPSLASRKYSKRKPPQSNDAKPSKCFTVIDEKGSRSIRGPNRNAVMAKLNRERKKQQMSEMEEKVGLLDTENDALKKQNNCLRKKVHVLARELQYVKSVLANQSTLSSLLKNIQATGLEFHTSFPSGSTTTASTVSQKRKRPSDHDYCAQQCVEGSHMKRVKSENAGEAVDETDEIVSNCGTETGGVCLHVSGESVSLEFCSKCCLKANLAGSKS